MEKWAINFQDHLCSLLEMVTWISGEFVENDENSAFLLVPLKEKASVLAFLLVFGIKIA